VLVLDGSVLVELVIAGKHRRGADALLDRYAGARGALLITAAHGLVEAASAIRRMGRQGELTGDEGVQAIGWLGQLNLVLDAPGPRLRRVWALRERMSAYDAAYAATAEALDAPLVSTDRRLLRACAAQGIAATHLDALARG
jgi:predicted nucleic acid-binding protein